MKIYTINLMMLLGIRSFKLQIQIPDLGRLPIFINIFGNGKNFFTSSVVLRHVCLSNIWATYSKYSSLKSNIKLKFS